MWFFFLSQKQYSHVFFNFSSNKERGKKPIVSLLRHLFNSLLIISRIVILTFIKTCFVANVNWDELYTVEILLTYKLQKKCSPQSKIRMTHRNNHHRISFKEKTHFVIYCLLHQHCRVWNDTLFLIDVYLISCNDSIENCGNHKSWLIH
jgi:hypothetical protein